MLCFIRQINITNKHWAFLRAEPDKAAPYQIKRWHTNDNAQTHWEGSHCWKLSYFLHYSVLEAAKPELIIHKSDPDSPNHPKLKRLIPLAEVELFSGLFSFGGSKTSAPHSQLWSWLPQITPSHSGFSSLNTGALQCGNGAISTNLGPSQVEFIILNEYWHKDWSCCTKNCKNGFLRKEQAGCFWMYHESGPG